MATTQLERPKNYHSCKPPDPYIQVQVISSHANVKTVGYLHLMELSIEYYVCIHGIMKMQEYEFQNL